MKPIRALVVCGLIFIAAVVILGAVARRNAPATPLGRGSLADLVFSLPLGSYLRSFFQETLRADFKGTVKDEAGNPIAGATVSLVIRPFQMPGMPPDPTPIISGMPMPKGTAPITFPVTTDTKGYYELHVSGLLISTNADLTCEAPGFTKESKGGNIMVGNTPPTQALQDFVLHPAVKLFGKVTNAVTGAPVHGATLRFGDPNGFQDDYRNSIHAAVTGADGSYEILLKPDCYGFSVEIEDESLRATPRQRVPIKVGADKPVAMNLALQPTVTLKGTVQSADGAPLPENCRLNTLAVLSQKYGEEPLGVGAFPGGKVPKFEASGDGTYRYEISGLIPGDSMGYVFQIDGFAPTNTGKLSISSTETQQTFDFRVTRGCALHGRLLFPDGTAAANRSLSFMPLSSGELQSGMTNYFRNQEYKTDRAGYFAFEHLAEGKYVISHKTSGTQNSYGGNAQAPSGTVVAVDGMHDVNGVVVTLRSGPAAVPEAISGVVLDPSGAAVPHAKVKAEGMNNQEYGTTTDASGEFLLKLPVARFAPDHFDITATSPLGKVTEYSVPTGDSVELYLKGAPGFAGTVLDVDGKALPDCPVSILEIIESGDDEFGPSERIVRQVLTRKTDDLGAFKFEGQHFVGSHVIVARHPSNGWGLSTLLPKSSARMSGIEIRVARGQSLRGHVIDTEGRPLGTALVQLYQTLLPVDAGENPLTISADESKPNYETSSADDGSFTFDSVMPGEYHAMVDRGGFASLYTPAITVAADQDPGEQTFVLGKGGCITCTLENPALPDIRTALHIEPAHHQFAQESEEGAKQFHECEFPADSYRAYVSYNGPGESVTSIIQKFTLKMDEQLELDAKPKPGSTTVSVKVTDFSGGEKIDVLPVDDKGKVIWGGDGGVTSGSGPVGADGTFTAHCIAPGDYLVAVDGPEAGLGEGCRPIILPQGMPSHLAERKITVRPNEPVVVVCSVAPSPDRTP